VGKFDEPEATELGDYVTDLWFFANIPRHSDVQFTPAWKTSLDDGPNETRLVSAVQDFYTPFQISSTGIREMENGEAPGTVDEDCRNAANPMREGGRFGDSSPHASGLQIHHVFQVKTG